jgi:C4-dicarboxylate transporter, DctQ subunit
MKILNNIIDKLSRLESSLIIILLGVMVILAFLQVILRNLFSFGFLWADPLLRYMVMWVGFLGAVIATREEKHFGVDFLTRYFSQRFLHGTKIFVDSFAAVVAFLLMRAAYQFLMEGIGAEEKDIFELPRRIYFAIIPLGFGLIGLHFVFNIIRHIHNLISNNNDVPHPEPTHSSS